MNNLYSVSEKQMGKGLGPTQGLSIEIGGTEAAQMVQRTLLNANPDGTRPRKKRGGESCSLFGTKFQIKKKIRFDCFD